MTFDNWQLTVETYMVHLYALLKKEKKRANPVRAPLGEGAGFVCITMSKNIVSVMFLTESVNLN